MSSRRPPGHVLLARIPVFSWPWAWLDIAIIAAIGLVFLWPVLSSPHFGLFSDYYQSIRVPAKALERFDLVDQIRPHADGRWNPLFHLSIIGVHALVGYSAFGFFFAQGLTLLVSLAICYVLGRWLAGGSRLAGYAACVLLLISTPFAESYFTLDKVEPRLLFFGFIAFAYFAFRLAKGAATGPIERWKAARVFLIHFLIAVLLIFSKETGAFIVAVAFLAFAAAFVETPRQDGRVRETALFFGGAALALFLFVVINNTWLDEQVRAQRAINSGGRYLNYAIAARLILDNARGYADWMRDTMICGAVFSIWCLTGLAKGLRRQWPDRQLMLFLIGAAGSLYFAGLLLWRLRLQYYMLPAAAFLAVAAAAIAFGPGAKWKPYILVLVFAYAFQSAPSRWRNGWAILAQDRAKDAIVHAIERQAPSHSRVVVALFDVNSVEIARSLLIYSTLDGYEAKDALGTFESDEGLPPSARIKKGGLRIYGFIEGPWVDYADFGRYGGSLAEPPNRGEIEEARDFHVPYVIWQYSPHAEQHRSWWPDPLRPGDLIALPVGSPRNIELVARGVQTFSRPRSFFLETRLRGVATRLVEENHVQLPFSNDFLGWDLLEVTAVDPSTRDLRGLERTQTGDGAHVYFGKGWSNIDWASEGAAHNDAFRWGYNGAEISSADRDRNLVLDIEDNGALVKGPMKLRAVDSSSGRELASWLVPGRTKHELVLPAGVTLRLIVPDEIKVSPDTICFRLFGVEER
jgi:hypothetical protein